MRSIVTAAVGLVIGVALGGLPSSSRLQGKEAQIAELEQRDCNPNNFAGAVTGMLRAPPSRSQVTTEPAILDTGVAVVTPKPGDPGFQTGVGADGTNPAMNEDFGVDAAETALEIRRAQARAALIEDVEPSDEQLAAIDDAMAAMSDDLEAIAGDLGSVFETPGHN